MAVEEEVEAIDSIGDPEVEGDGLGEGLAELELLSDAGRETDADSVIEVDIEVLRVALFEGDVVADSELLNESDSVAVGVSEDKDGEILGVGVGQELTGQSKNT